MDCPGSEAVTFIIAEAGVNHNGDIQLAKQLVDAAKSSGADAVKFQSFIASEEISSYAPKALYQQRNDPNSSSQLEMVQKLELSPNEQYELYQYAQHIGIEFMSSAFDLVSLQMLYDFGITRWKVPSGEITNLPYLTAIASFGQEIILSTGMCSLGEVEQAIALLNRNGVKSSQLTLLHCTTEYPAPPEEVNLLAMCTMKSAFQVKVGYSDHTLGYTVPVAAVALGASVLEKHLTLSKDMEGPDHKASLEPHQFTQMVEHVRLTETILGSGIKAPSPSEIKNISVARKSLVARTEIQPGDVFTVENVTTKRPGSGISPMNWHSVIGRTSHKYFQVDELITLP